MRKQKDTQAISCDRVVEICSFKVVHQFQRWVSDHQTSLSERFARGLKELCKSSMKKQLIFYAAIKGVILATVLYSLETLVDKNKIIKTSM